MLFSVAHAILALAVFLAAYTLSMADFDDPSRGHPYLAPTARGVASILMLPIADPVFEKGLVRGRPAMAISVWLANSAVWGFALAAMVQISRAFKRRANRETPHSG